MEIVGDFLKAVGQLADAAFLRILALSLGLTVAILAGVAAILGWLVSWIPSHVTIPWVGQIPTFSDWLGGFAAGGTLLGSVVLMIPVAVIFVNLFLDRIAGAVERRHYPADPPGKDQGMLEGAWIGISFAIVVVIANLVGLIVYLISGPAAPFVFYIVNGYLLGRTYFETVAYRYRGWAGAKRLRRRHRGVTLLAGILMAIPLTIPVVNLVMPFVGVATFVHTVKRILREDAAA